MKDGNVEIAIIMFSDAGRTIDFSGFSIGKDYLDEHEINPGFFFNNTGGFEVKLDGYKTIYKGFQFYVAIKGIHFLLHTLYWLNGKNGSFDKNNEYPNDVVATFQDDSFVRLSHVDSDLLELHYLPKDKSLTHVRGDRYFTGQKISLTGWYNATLIAIDEYLGVLEKILKEFPDDYKTHILQKHYVDVWKALKK